MTPSRWARWGGVLLLGALATPAPAAEVAATPVCNKSRPTTAFYAAPACPTTACYDPCCERVGPIRRFFRRVFRPCCPPPPCCPPAGVVAPVVAAPAPVIVPPRAVVVPPSAELGRPAPPPPPPGPDPLLTPSTGSSYRRLTPPTPPPPVRLDRMASTSSGMTGTVVCSKRVPQAHAQVTLVSAAKPSEQQSVKADADGRFDVRLAPGSWVVYTRGADGKPVRHGAVEVRAHQTKKVTVVGW